MRKNWLLIGVGLLTAVLTAGALACDDAVRGSGNVVTEEMAFADFTGIEASHAFVVDIVQSDSFSVTIRVDDNILDMLDVSSEGDTLRLRLDRGVSLRDVTMEASITMPALARLRLSGAARASVSGFRSLDELDIELSGASKLDGDLEAGETDIEASGASKVTLGGSATGLTIRGSGASKLDLADFTVDTAEVRLSGASEATLHARERIDPVDLSGASRLRYLGNPSLGHVNTSGAASLDSLED